MHIVAIGGSDAGISAALRARELDASVDVTVVVADEYPNYSICGIPYYFTGDVKPWQSLAHRTHADLEATGMRLRLNTLATRIDADQGRLTVLDEDGQSEISYDELIVGTGALPSFAGIAGLGELGPEDGVHVIHSMGDTFALDAHLAGRAPSSAVIIGAGYVGLEMAEGFRARGMRVTQLQRGPEVLSTIDAELAVLVHEELVEHGVDVHTNTIVRPLRRQAPGSWFMRTTSASRCRTPRTWFSRSSASAPTRLCSRTPGRSWVPAAPWWSTSRCAPASRTCSLRATASSPTTACSARPISRSARLRTSRAASPARTHSAARSASRDRSAHRS